MASSTLLKLGYCAILACMLMDAPLATKAAISCDTVTSTLAPCVSFLTGNGVPSASCCSGVGTLASMASTTPDRQSTCTCLKSAASAITNLNYNNAASLPTKCGVNIPYKISPSTDCSTVQ